MGINANVTNEQITATVGETKIDVAVSGGFGPSGAAGSNGQAATIAVGTVTTGAAGSSASVTNVGTSSAAIFNFTIPAGATGATGPQGPAGTTTWAGITDKPSTFTPSAHTHSGGDISFTAFDTAFSAGTDSPVASFLYGVDQGDSGHLVDNFLQPALENSYAAVSHAHSASAITSGTLDIARIPTGTSSTTVALGDHTHSQLHDRSHAITSSSDHTATAWRIFYSNGSGVITELTLGTSGQALLSNGASAAPSWGTAAADVSIDTTAADILSASSGSITADDAGSDKLVFWDDSAGKLTYLSAGTNITITDTTISAAGSTSASDLTSGTLAYARMADPTVTSPSQITASQNDYSGFARGINRFTTNAARDLTGMVAGSDGEVRVLTNVGTTAANTLTIKDESASSTAANRFSVPWNGDCVIPAEGSVVVFYDGTSQRWRVIA